MKNLGPPKTHSSIRDRLTIENTDKSFPLFCERLTLNKMESVSLGSLNLLVFVLGPFILEVWYNQKFHEM